MIGRLFRPTAEEKMLYTTADLHEEHLKLKEEHKALAERQDALRRDHEGLNTKLDRILGIVSDTNMKVTRIYEAIPWIEFKVRG